MHLGFVFLHQKVYDFGRLLHLLLSLWPSQTVKENQAGRALHEPSSGATVIRKTGFFCYLCGCSSVPITHFLLHNIQLCTICMTLKILYGHNRRVWQHLREEIKEYEQLYGNMLYIGYNSLKAGQTTEKTRREKRSISEPELWISVVFNRS